ncbi:MAG: hypothetical protein OJF47_003977 [Nitrospira sp.]|jgi:hypothetical protein|nr:MAG: hypothetical protein OJF47_003977 [Nitrospira sp.]
MNRKMIVIVTLALMVTGACSGKPTKKQFQLLAGEFVSPVHITKPVDQQSAVIGITVKSPLWTPNTEDRLYLVKIENDRDLFHGTRLIPTSIVAPPPGGGGGGTVYVQNVPPGRYAAVAFSTSEKGYGKIREVTLYLLPKDVVKQSDTTVAPGGIGFMGEYELGPSTMILNEKAADEVEEHYFEVFWGKPLAQVVADLQAIGTPAYFAAHTVGVTKADRDAVAEERFLATAKRDLEPSWTPLIERRRTAAK